MQSNVHSGKQDSFHVQPLDVLVPPRPAIISKVYGTRTVYGHFPHYSLACSGPRRTSPSRDPDPASLVCSPLAHILRPALANEPPAIIGLQPRIPPFAPAAGCWPRCLAGCCCRCRRGRGPRLGAGWVPVFIGCGLLVESPIHVVHACLSHHALFPR
jgi:hypothetical protein